MTVRVACLGAGYFSHFHIDGWRRIAGAELVAVCDRDIAGAEATGAPAFAALGDMLEEVRPDILDIILPPAGQAEAIRTAVAAGVQTIICQKPFCTSLAEARAMAGLAEDHGVRLIVHENFRFQPWYRAIKAEVDEGMIGEVLQATFRLRPGDGQGAEAYRDRQPYFCDMPRFLIHETAVHFVDLFRFLFGDFTSVYGDLQRVNPVLKGEDAGHVLGVHAGGVRSLFDANRCLDHAADNPRRTMGEALIEGTRGVLELRGDGSVRQRAFGDLYATEILPPDDFDGFGGDCTRALQAHVIAALNNEGPFENLAADYLRVIEIEEAIYRSADMGQKVDLT